MVFSRILTLLAGALVSAVVLRWKDDKAKDANTAPWRPEIEELHKKLMLHLDERDAGLAARIAEFQPRIEALAAELKVEPDTRLDELAVRIGQLQPKIEALAAGLAKPDPRIESLATRLAAVESRPVAVETAHKPDPRVEAIAVRLTAVESRATATEDKLGELAQKVVQQDQRMQATNKVVVAIEQLLTSKIGEFDQRIEAQGRSLQAMNSSIAQSDELLERVLDLVQNLAPAVMETREPISIAASGGEIRELQL
jgi:septal ring factor EnvC (AmiA/AmiB activator)